MAPPRARKLNQSPPDCEGTTSSEGWTLPRDDARSTAGIGVGTHHTEGD